MSSGSRAPSRCHTAGRLGPGLRGLGAAARISGEEAAAAASNSRRPSGSGAGSPAAPAERHALARPARGGGGGAAPSRGVRAELSGGLCSCGLLCLEGSRAAGLGPLSRTASPPPAALTAAGGGRCVSARPKRGVCNCRPAVQYRAGALGHCSDPRALCAPLLEF
ncbi:unnamed protein product [Prorocentrum cordatum]|uniref:Uncharacterized protein n=1 Tax=Prorocentrum cordatum TaxID=2364126 RepID=A0ABN9XEZ5_9DINO|nr:unnamed protein product [Polarella glacialis]